MIINVTEKNLAEGRKRGCVGCPIGLSVQAAYNFKRRVDVTDKMIIIHPERIWGTPYSYYKTKGRKEVYKMDAELAAIVEAIDNNFLIDPFTFHLVAGWARADKYGWTEEPDFYK